MPRRHLIAAKRVADPPRASSACDPAASEAVRHPSSSTYHVVSRRCHVAIPVKKTHRSLFSLNFSLCLSRACLGKMISCSIKWHRDFRLRTCTSGRPPVSTPWRGVLCIASQPRAERDSPHAGAIGPALNMPVVDPSFRMPPLVGARGVMSPLRCDAKRASRHSQSASQSVSLQTDRGGNSGGRAGAAGAAGAAGRLTKVVPSRWLSYGCSKAILSRAAPVDAKAPSR